MIEVCPGYSIPVAEYEKRFKGVNLEHFKERMSPELFKAFVRSAGSIDGYGIELEDLFNGY